MISSTRKSAVLDIVWFVIC